jgi:exopolysaccharide production protein ExoZ
LLKQKYGSPILPASAHFGAFGVDLFFVISGFIMAIVAEDGVSWPSFLVGRARRILPPYWFYTTVVLVVSLAAPTIVNSSLGTPPSLWRSYLLIPDSGPPLLAVRRTLVHEAYFYVAFAGMLFLIRSYRLTLPRLLLVWAAAVICLDTFFRFYGVTAPVSAVVAHPLTLQFIFGAFVGILILRETTDFGGLALLVDVSLLAIALLGFPGEAPSLLVDKMWERVLVIGLPCVLTVYGAVALERHRPGWSLSVTGRTRRI